MGKAKRGHASSCLGDEDGPEETSLGPKMLRISVQQLYAINLIFSLCNLPSPATSKINEVVFRRQNEHTSTVPGNLPCTESWTKRYLAVQHRCHVHMRARTRRLIGGEWAGASEQKLRPRQCDGENICMSTQKAQALGQRQCACARRTTLPVLLLI